MEHKISATDLARRVGDILGRIRYRGDSFLVERNGELVARLVPVAEHPVATLREAAAAWAQAGPADDGFAADLERVLAADLPAEDPWAS
jgi:antitoxin (DNA-binding transcriptional repressor) of toxin-antitoxin stability system